MFDLNELYVIRDVLWNRLKFLTEKYPENKDISRLKSLINKVDDIVLKGGNINA